LQKVATHRVLEVKTGLCQTNMHEALRDTMTCVIVSRSIYVISFVISSFNTSVVLFFCATLKYPHNQKSRSVKSGDGGGHRVSIDRSSKKLWIITMDSLVTGHVAPYYRK